MRWDETILAEKEITTHSPQITIESVSEVRDGVFQVVWSASDDDGDPIDYLVGFAAEGTSYFPLDGAIVRSGERYSMEFESFPLPGGEACHLRIIGTDGVNTVEQVSEDFVVEKKDPVVQILSPVDGDEYFLEDEICFDGFGYDNDDGMLDAAMFTWTSSIDGEFKAGSDAFSFSELSRGEHRITLTVTDSDGNSASEEISIDVKRSGLCFLESTM